MWLVLLLLAVYAEPVILLATLLKSVGVRSRDEEDEVWGRRRPLLSQGCGLGNFFCKTCTLLVMSMAGLHSCSIQSCCTEPCNANIMMTSAVHIAASSFIAVCLS